MGLVIDPSTVSELQTSTVVNAWMASIIASSNEAIVSGKLQGVFSSWNPAAERMYGYSAEEMIGNSFSILVPAHLANEMAEILPKVRRGERIEHFETVRIRKDGSTISVSLTISPIYNDSGDVVGISSIARDLTERERASKYASDILESAPEAMIIVDKIGTIVVVNARTEKLFGYHRGELLGQPVDLLVPSRFRAEIRGTRDRFFANPVAEPMGVGLDLYGLHKGGREFPIEISRSPIETTDGVLVAVAVRDVTDHKQMIRRLEEMNELRNEFVAVVAHDLRSPMTSISGFAHLLADQWNELDDDTKLQYLEIIASNTDRFAEFVEDVLQVARIEAGEYNYDNHLLDVRLLAEKIFDDVTGSNGKRQFEFIAPEDLPVAFGDAERQTQILTNLLSNAIKFSPAEEPIIVRLSCVDSSVQVSVTDRGIGITGDDLAKLFQKSGRVFRAGDPKRPGNGLGLYICKTLVEAQGGRIWCDSNPDQGSTFSYTIPVAP